MQNDLKTLPISALARLVLQDWKVVNYAAKPYLSAMLQLQDVRDAYGYDSGASVVRYFLANATAWRGETARNIKAELNARIKNIY